MWLTPSEPLCSRLRSIIRRLATALDAVEFEPHVTVFCGPSTEEEARWAVQRIARQMSPIELTAEGLNHTEVYTKTLFVQFRESAAARQMFEMARGFAPGSNYVLNPHLSLLYKRLPRADRLELCKTLDAPLGAYSFNRIAMIETEAPIEDDGPIRRWRTVCAEPLAGA